MVILVYIASVLLFGSTWVAIKIGLQTFPPFTSAVVRAIVAFIFFFLVFRLWRFRFPKTAGIKKDFFFSSVIMSGICVALIYWGQERIPAATSAIIFATMPFFTGLFAHYMLPDEKLTPRVVLGQIIGFAGTVVLFGDDLRFGGAFIGMVAMLVSSFGASWATVKIKRDLHDIDPVPLAILMTPVGLIVLIPIMLVAEYPIHLWLDERGVGSIIYLAIFGTGLAFMGWYYLLKRISTVALTLMTFLEPLIAAVLGYLFLSERLSAYAILGGAMILAGVLIVGLRKKQL